MIGDYTYVNDYSRIYHAKVGRFCSISWFCVIAPSEHYLDRVSTSPYLYDTKNFLGSNHADPDPIPSEIGSDVWVGANAVILQGVKVGHGSVIGAGSVVTKDVPPYAIVGGVPARVTKMRFQPETIEHILTLRWWEWPLEEIRRHPEMFADPLNRTLVTLA